MSFPLKTNKVHNNLNKTWFNTGTKKSSETLKYLYRLWKAGQIDVRIINAKTTEKLYLQPSKRIQNIGQRVGFSDKVKTIWNIINNNLGSKAIHKTPVAINKIDSLNITDTLDISNAFNEYIASVAKHYPLLRPSHPV